MTEPPTRCLRGQELGPGRVLVGHVACTGHGGGGHTLWHCRACEAITHEPPLAAHCTELEDDRCGGIPTPLDDVGDLYKGGTAHGNVCVSVPAGADGLWSLATGFGAPAFFSTR